MQQSKKIIHVINSLDIGGAENFLIQLANEQSKLNDVTLVTLYSSNRFIKLNRNIKIIEILKIKNLTVISKLLKIISFWVKNRKMFDDKHYINLHLTGAISLAPLLKILKIKSTLIIIIHYIGGNTRKISKLIAALGSFFSDKIVYVAPTNYRNVNVKKKLIIPNGIKFSNPQIKYENKPNILKIGTVSRLNSDRMPEKFIYLCQELRKLNLPFQFSLFGNGPLIEKLESIILQLQLESCVQIVEFESDSQKQLSDLNLYISMNTGSITGLAAYEAINFGLYSLGIQWDKNYVGENDWLPSFYDLSKLADKIAQVFANWEELQTLAQIQNSYMRSEFSIETCASRYYHHVYL